MFLNVLGLMPLPALALLTGNSSQIRFPVFAHELSLFCFAVILKDQMGLTSALQLKAPDGQRMLELGHAKLFIAATIWLQHVGHCDCELP